MSATLIYEEKMRELIDLMPPIVNPNGEFKINYDHGTEYVLNKYLLLPRSETIYPLIWLISGENTKDISRNTISNKSRFVIAKKSEHVDKFNDYQFNNDFKNVLVPVYSNFEKLLQISGITTILNNKIIYKPAPNYSVTEKDNKGLIVVWNAIIVDVDLKMDGRACINKNLKF